MSARIERALLALLCLALGILLSAAVLGLPEADGTLRDAALAAMPRSGVENPVTAALLNYRGFDTLLETVVLLFALLSCWTADPDPERPAQAPAGRSPAPALVLFARILVPVGALVAIHLYWAGTKAPGGAFQAATLLAAVAILLNQSRPAWIVPVLTWRIRLLLGTGPALFLAIGLAGLVRYGVFLGFPPDFAGPAILAIEAGLTLSIAVMLAMLVVGPPGRLR